MIDELEADLRTVLRARGAEVPAASLARVANRDYRPRMRSLRPPLAAGGVAGAAGAIVAAVSLGAGASNAFAGWTPTPTPPTPEQLATARLHCSTKSPQSPVAGLPLKLIDTRGPFSFAVYANATTSATCISGPSFTSISTSVSSAPGPALAPSKIALWSEHLTKPGGQHYSFADGHAGVNVKDVTLVLDDGTKVDATVSNGWFVAWWPSSGAVKSALVTTPSGTTTQGFLVGSASPCGARLCRRETQSIGGSGPGAQRAISGSSEAAGSVAGSGSSRGVATFQSTSG